jgi:DNA polymerase elongation subunit (family B)
MLSEVRDIIFLDIETVAHHYDYQALDERMKSQWARKASYFRRDTNLTDEDVYRDRAGIYAEFGKVVCIAVGKFIETESGEIVLRTKSYSGNDEKVLLLEFKSMLERMDPMSTRLCAHNGKEFDFPYLCRRMLINCIQLPSILNLSGRKSWEVQHLDTMELWKFGDYKHFTSLDLLATIFNIPSSKSGIDGSQVNAVYHVENGLDRIVEYCVRDVVVLAQLFLKMKCITLDKGFVVQSAS